MALSIPLLLASFFLLVVLDLNLFCLLSIRSAVVEFLKPLVEERRERERGEEGWGEGDL